MPSKFEPQSSDQHSCRTTDTLFLGDSELAQRLRDLDWAATPLSPPDGWPQSLKTAVRIMLTSRQPIWIGWGQDLIYLYNDPYKSIIGGKHPWALGKPTSIVWREIWEDIGPMLGRAMGGQEGTYVEAQLLIMERHGYPEETYYTFSYSPIPADDGTAGGIFCANTDDTQRVIGERQLALLRELAAGTNDARTWQQACEHSARALATNPRDLPFGMIYMLEPDGETATLAGAAGISTDHPAAAPRLNVNAGGPWPLAEVLREHRASVCDLNQMFGTEFPRGAWQVAPGRAAVLPIPASGGTGRAGFLIAGLNPFRLFDDNYAGFLDLVVGQIAAALTNAEAFEQARRRAEALADIDRARRITELADANARLMQEVARREHVEGQFQHLVESVAEYAVFMLNPRGIVSSWNTGAERIKGYRPSEIIGRHFENFYTEEDRAAGVPARALETAIREGKFEAEGWRVRKDGSQFWASVVINPIRDEGNLIGFAKVTRDITERREAEEALLRTQAQLAQAQKMEGIGQLTGGVAHDFNNLLTVIIGNLESIQRQIRAATPDRARLERSTDLAMRGARRAEALTQRLLAYSRQQPLTPKPIDIGRLVAGMSDLLRRTIGEQIAVETVLAGGVWRTYADPNHLEVAILNLAVNARDAMPQGGKLTIETGNVHLDERYAGDHTEVSPGQYVMVAVSDTGTGMSREVVVRAFEPFFTTKGVGHGTGLGLSQVYGFVKQSGGHVKIYSEVGVGTTVKLYFPRLHADEPEIVEAPAVHPQGVSGTETILVVEDDQDVRAYTSETLRELGYRVLEAGNGAAALQRLDEHADIELLFTDIGLPGGMNGRQLSVAALQRHPRLKVLFTTGYARNAIVHDGRLDPGVELVTKPFNQTVLAARLRDILDARSAPARILVVEDEVLLQMLAIDTLEEAGFKVDTAGSATEAMNKLRLIPGGVDAAMVDIGLPDRGGDMLVRELRAVYPALPIVIASGRNAAELQNHFKSEARMAFIGKPYSSDDVLGALRTVGIFRSTT